MVEQYLCLEVVRSITLAVVSFCCIQARGHALQLSYHTKIIRDVPNMYTCMYMYMLTKILPNVGTFCVHVGVMQCNFRVDVVCHVGCLHWFIILRSLQYLYMSVLISLLLLLGSKLVIMWPYPAISGWEYKHLCAWLANNDTCHFGCIQLYIYICTYGHSSSCGAAHCVSIVVMQASSCV